MGRVKKMISCFRCVLGAGCLLLGLVGCQTSQRQEALQRFEFSQPHMGTLFSITLYAPDEISARAASEAAFAKVRELNAIMSDYEPESELMRLCQKPVSEPVRVSDELFYVLEKSQRTAELSDGAFDATVGPVVRLWRRARRTGNMPSPELLTRAREAVGWKKLKLDAANKTVTLTVSGMQLDLGGIGKGYAADKALEVLKQRGMTRSLIAASGDIAAGEAPPGKEGWRVGIGMLDSKTNELARVLLLKNTAVSTSGDAEQFVEIDGKRYSHIVDPRTGIGVTERLQVTVVTKRGVDSDSIDTAISVLGVERGLKLANSQGVAALIFRKNGESQQTFESANWRKVRLTEKEQ